MTIWKTAINLDLIKKRSAHSVLEYFGIEFTEIGDDYILAKMPITPKTHQPVGILHGGVSCVVAESLGSIGANYAVDASKEYCVGLDINTNHIRSIRDGYIFAKTWPYHIGRSTHVWHIEAKNANDQLIFVSRLTMAVLKKAVSSGKQIS